MKRLSYIILFVCCLTVLCSCEKEKEMVSWGNASATVNKVFYSIMQDKHPSDQFPTYRLTMTDNHFSAVLPFRMKSKDGDILNLFVVVEADEKILLHKNYPITVQSDASSKNSQYSRIGKFNATSGWVHFDGVLQGTKKKSKVKGLTGKFSMYKDDNAGLTELLVKGEFNRLTVTTVDERTFY